MTTSTFTIDCPLCLVGEATARDAGFSATSVTVRPCSACADRNLGLVSLELRKSRAMQLARTGAAAVSHTDGLVVFSQT